MKFRRLLSLLLSLTVVFTAAFGYAAPAFAKSSRAAEVVEVVGDVQITKAGGSKSYRAYIGMTLNQGHNVKTGKGAKLVLNITDHDDELTIDQNASLYISELTEEGKGKKSKVKMWAGSLWSKVKTLAGAEDEFEVETPTAVMGVRGTNLFAGVDQESGDSTFMIGSGFGEIKKNGNNNSTVFLYPSQQLKLMFGDSIEDLNDQVSVIDLDTFVANAGPAIIEAIVQNKAALDQENAEFIEKQKQAIEQGATTEQSEQLGIKSLEDLNRVTSNLDNLIGNIVNKAIEQNKVDSGRIQEVIDKTNETLEKKIDLKAVKPIEITNEEKAKLEELKRLEEERKKQLEEEKKRQEELKKQNEELLKRLEEQKKKQEEANRLATEEAKKKAEEELRKRLDDEALAALLARQAELERQRQQQEQQSQRNTNVDNRTEQTTDTTNRDSSSTDGTVSSPSSRLIFEKSELDNGDIALVVSIENFTGSNSLSAAQLNMIYDERLYTYSVSDEGMDHVLDDNGTDSVIRFEPNISVAVPESDAVQLESLFGYEREDVAIAPEYEELLYAEVKATSGAKAVAGKTILMVVVIDDYYLEEDADIRILLKKALFVRADGSSIPATISGSGITSDALGYVVDFASLPSIDPDLINIVVSLQPQMD